MLRIVSIFSRSRLARRLCPSVYDGAICAMKNQREYDGRTHEQGEPNF